MTYAPIGLNKNSCEINELYPGEGSSPFSPFKYSFDVDSFDSLNE